MTQEKEKRSQYILDILDAVAEGKPPLETLEAIEKHNADDNQQDLAEQEAEMYKTRVRRTLAILPIVDEATIIKKDANQSAERQTDITVKLKYGSKVTRVRVFLGRDEGELEARKKILRTTTDRQLMEDYEFYNLMLERNTVFIDASLNSKGVQQSFIEQVNAIGSYHDLLKSKPNS